MKSDLTDLITEQTNDQTTEIDCLDTMSVLKLINDEDKMVAYSVEKILPDVAKAVDIIVTQIGQKSGRLVYIGAGTSGRLGVLDASECPPTFNVSSSMVVGLIAGGDIALRNAIEGSEDIEENGRNDLEKINFNENDVLVGIAASGRTPYVIGALKYARCIGAKTVSISCNKNAVISQYSDIPIEVIVGPEVISGSTRMKSGTAQKMVLNILSTATMIKLGKTYKNYMVDLQAKNEKLRLRAIGIIKKITGVEEDVAKNVLQNTNWNVKLSVIIIKGNVSKEKAEIALKECNGSVSKALAVLSY